MNTRTMIPLLVVCLLGFAPQPTLADEPDRGLMKRVDARLAGLGKNPVPVFARTTGKGGRIKLADTGNQAAGKGVTAWYNPMGWLTDCTWPVSEGDVFYNAGKTPVIVQGVPLRKGTYVVFHAGKFRQVTLQVLRAL